MIVEPGFHDWTGEWREANPDTLRLVREIVDEHPPNASAYEVTNAAAPDAPRCVLPDARRVGIAAQVYALWSDVSGGIGDLHDVAELARLSGAQLLLLSPLHAPWPGLPQEPSPYFPSSRQYRNPLLLRVDGVHLPNDPSVPIDHDAVWQAKSAALAQEWKEFAGDAAFDAYCEREGEDLANFAAFCARADGADAAFHQWVQWRIDVQLQDAAASGAGVIHDIAVGFDPHGADAWMWRDLVAPDMHIGAPADEFNRDGQDWGAPPFVPDRLAAASYRPVVAALEAAAAHGAGIRIDHVMGFFRLFWIPDGGSPSDGVYVRYPAAELLDAVAEVSQRFGVFVIGEDLGTVEPGVREALASRGVLSYKVRWFEHAPARDWPPLSVAAATTHDLPTVAGKGEDVGAVHTELLGAGSVVVLLSADDLLGATEQPNHPGGADPWNWRRRLPAPVTELATKFATTLVK